MQLDGYQALYVKQQFEGFELIGYETRNKYAILDEKQNKIGFAAEQQKGVLGFLLRQFLGHWRKFEVHFYDEHRKEFMIATHPFRWFFQRFEVRSADGELYGSLQQRFSILSKKFDLEDGHGRVIANMHSPFWRIWTFPIFKKGQEVGRIEKKWTGILAEAFTDKDTFKVNFISPSLSNKEKLVYLAASVFIDLQYFETKSDS